MTFKHCTLIADQRLGMISALNYRCDGIGES
jgi:hypothetical protein